MSHYLVRKSLLTGEMTVPSSKSHTLRAILFGALGKGKTIVHHYLPSPDAQAMIDTCRLLGATVNVFPDYLEIEGLNGKIIQAEDVIDAGNSGLVLRMIAAVGALASKPIVITGDHSIRHQRPMETLMSGLRQLGVSAVSTRGNGYAPIIIQGPLQSGKVVINGEDSQPVSSLLIASIFAPGPVEIVVKNAGEKPWVRLTLDWLDRLGIPYEENDLSHFHMHGKGGFDGFDYKVPGDFSSAAFPIAAALTTNSEILLHNIDMGDSQGDKEVVSVFQKMGAKIDINPEARTLHVKKGSSLQGIDIDINNFVDAITILAVVGCFAEGKTRIRNAEIARQKECNRIECIAKELRKMGATVEEHIDGLTIVPSRLQGTEVFSHHDHRTAMSLAVAGLGASAETKINGIECVDKTFPTFAAVFKELGADLEVIR